MNRFSRKTKIIAAVAVFILLVVVIFAVINGTGNKRYRTVACAAEVTEQAQKSSSGSTGSKSSSGSTGSKSSSSKATPPSQQNKNAKPPSSQHAEAHKNQAKPPPGQNVKSKVTPPGEKSYTPPPADKRPPAKQYDKAANSAPERLSRGGSYRSPVTNHTYVYHDPIYYSSPGYRLDLFDPYNPWNYTNPLSPFYNRPYVVVDRC